MHKEKTDFHGPMITIVICDLIGSNKENYSETCKHITHINQKYNSQSPLNTNYVPKCGRLR